MLIASAIAGTTAACGCGCVPKNGNHRKTANSPANINEAGMTRALVAVAACTLAAVAAAEFERWDRVDNVDFAGEVLQTDCTAKEVQLRQCQETCAALDGCMSFAFNSSCWPLGANFRVLESERLGMSVFLRPGGASDVAAISDPAKDPDCDSICQFYRRGCNSPGTDDAAVFHACQGLVDGCPETMARTEERARAGEAAAVATPEAETEDEDKAPTEWVTRSIHGTPARCKVEAGGASLASNPKTASNPKRIALVLRGQSFRDWSAQGHGTQQT
jgi:hypothetical protein